MRAVSLYTGWENHADDWDRAIQRHHKEDVIAGSLIGAVSALIAYLMYWRNPFSSRTFTIGLGGPRAVYADAELERSGRLDGFELTSMDDDREPV